MDKKIDRKIVSTILFKDDNNLYHRLFQVEGDKDNDYSIYIVKLNQVKDQINLDEHIYRDFSLQKTIHSKIDKNGYVQAHFKRNGHIFGKSKCLPLDKLNYVFDHSLSEKEDIDDYPIKLPDINDILIKSRCKYLSDYRFIFYKGEELLSKYVSGHNLYILHKKQIPTNNTKGHMFALAIDLSKLIEIQSVN